MNVPVSALIVTFLIFGFLTGSTLFFYNQAKVRKADRSEQGYNFNAEIPKSVDANTPDQVDAATKPAEPKGRPSYPANVYYVNPNETLFAIGNKFNLPWTLIVEANGISDANLIQANYPLVIPKYNKNTDYYRVNFVLNDEKLSELNRQLRNANESDYFDPIKVAKKYAVPYFGVSENDSFTLVEKDLSKGTALVEAKSDGQTNVIGLIQPKTKGEKGIWAVLYVEKHE
jgi:LysM repeat protein